MTASTPIACCPESVKSHLCGMFEEAVDKLLVDDTLSPRAMEEAVWNLLIQVGRELLASLLMMACWRITARETEGRRVRLRLDNDYIISHSTTLGVLRVPLFAYRDEQQRTHTPARDALFPLHPRCRSSELCLEWETRLGSNLPFRQAEEAMDFYSHGAARIEDTTIARHIGVIGELVDEQWTYRAPEDIKQILRDRATRDAKTGRPILYTSSDAHALRRFDDDTWEAPWKMINGIRLWCVDGDNGGIIHLGGEYTWGNCREVGERFDKLVKRLNGIDAQWVFISDGMLWFREHVMPRLPEDTTFILDLYHVLERVGEFASKRFGSGTAATKRFMRGAKTILMGKRPYHRKKLQKRKGHKKQPRKRKRNRNRTVHPSKDPCGAGEEFLWTLIEGCEKPDDNFKAIVNYISTNSDRMDYPAYRARGMQIGSGAMESLHRVASQMRLKLAGARWLPERALAVLNCRLMLLAERWDAFWSHESRSSTIRDAFDKHSVST